MIIEMYGLPGVGKTVYAHSYVVDNHFEIIKVKSKIELIIFNIFFLFLHPKIFYGFFKLCFQNSKTNKIWRTKFINSFLYRNAKWQKALFFRRNNIIIDEGHFQNLLSFFDREVSKGEMEQFISLCIKPDILYIVTTESQIRYERLNKRGYRGREVFGQEYIKQWEDIMSKNNNLFLRILPNCDIKYKIIESPNA